MRSAFVVKSADGLVTPREMTRAGFISLALEKNYLAVPYVEEAKALKSLSSKVPNPIDLLQVQDLRLGLLTASGLSDKAQNYLTEDDKTVAIKEFIEKFLEPAGKGFVDELVYRYLLTKGDALGGRARNLAGTLGERKFLRSLLSVLNLSGIDYQWRDRITGVWFPKSVDDTDIEKRISCITWSRSDVHRLLILNTTIPIVKKNVDLSILNGSASQLHAAKGSILHQIDAYVALGELKGGIDPAGADEHWKTANSALERIRKSFNKLKRKPQTFFIGAAIESNMAVEIFKQLRSGILSNAANLTDDDQLTSICEWIMNL